MSWTGSTRCSFLCSLIGVRWCTTRTREPIAPNLLADLRQFHSQLVDEHTPVARQLGQLLSRAEIATVAKRTASLVRAGSYPAPVPQRRNYPWPPI